MNYNPEIHHRRSIRLKDYDYSQKGAYFVTVCSWNRECLFGDIVNGDMRLNESGHIVEKEWQRTGDIRLNVELDAFVIMPNHIHGVLVIVDDGRGTLQRAPTKELRQKKSIQFAEHRGFLFGSAIIMNALSAMKEN